MNEHCKVSELSADELLDSIRGSLSRNELSSGLQRSEPRSSDAIEDAPPLVADEARESIGEAFAALTKATHAEPDFPIGHAKEPIMEAVPVETRVRPLSKIEEDLLAAEGQFADAEARRKQAEADAQAALDGINKYQAEIDAAIDRLRQISPAGSNWSRLVDRSSNVLTLREELPHDPVVRANFNLSAKT